MWKIAIAVSVAVVLGLACRGKDVGATDQAPSGSGLAHEVLAQIVATSAETNGTVEIRRNGDVRWETIAVGATFRQRDWVRTGARSYVRLRFAHSYVDLTENTTVLIDDAITIDAGSVVGVADGEHALVVSAADGSRATIGATGDGPAEFRLTPSATKGVEIAVTKGSLKVTTPDGDRIVNAGEAADLAHAHASDVVKLLGFPNSLVPGVDARFLFAPRMQIKLTWGTVVGAVHYYVQIARDTDFHTLVLTAETTTPDTTLGPDREGIYVWRVAARDAAGRQGEYGFARRIYVENDQPRDLLVAPRDGFAVEFPNKPPVVEFSWRSLGETKKYKLVITRGDPGSAPIISTTTTAQHLTETLDEGTYQWRVYSLEADQERPIFLSLRQLTIRKLQGPKIHTEVQWH